MLIMGEKQFRDLFFVVNFPENGLFSTLYTWLSLNDISVLGFQYPAGAIGEQLFHLG